MDRRLSGHSALHEYLAVLRRRKWLVLLAVVLVPAAAVGFSLTQKPKYQATAEVLLSRQNLAASLNNVIDPNLTVSPERLIQTQADIAAVPQVARRVVAAAGIRGLTAAQFLAASSVSAKTGADLLVFKVANREPTLAKRLATLYARAYIDYRQQLDTAGLERARLELSGRISAVEAAGDRKSALYASLVGKEQQLTTMEALQTSNAYLVRPADGASQIQPRPVRNGILGLALGLVLGLGLAFLREALDTRVRSADDIGDRLELPLLARIPTPPRALRSDDKLVMIAEPRSAKAEPFRMLRANLEFVSREQEARTIAVTSALEGEGKSTTAANLAVALARAGEHVVLVDLDLRRPYLDRFFRIQDRPNLIDVVLNRAPLEAALVPIALGGTPSGSRVASDNGPARATGMLEVLTAGPLLRNPGEIAGLSSVANILASLAKRARFVIVDTAPLLSVGDTLAMSDSVDAMLLVARLKMLRKPMLKELSRLLEGAPVEVLGFVVTEAEAEDRYGGYGYYYHYGYGQSRGRRLYGAETPEESDRIRV